MEGTMPTRSQPGHAFTLLELLVVVAVIALLLAILLPALSAAMEAGRAAVCGTRLNQIGIGTLSFAEANENRLPYFGGADTGRSQHLEFWVTQIARTIDAFEPQIYACPSDPIPKPIEVYQFDGVVYDGNTLRAMDSRLAREIARRRRRRVLVKVTYHGACGLLTRASATDSTLVPRNVTDWKRPHKAILLVEGYAFPNYSPQMSDNLHRSCYRFGTLGALKRGRVNATWNRHFGTTNVLFMDGHVRNFSPPDIGHLGGQQEHVMW